MTHQKYLKMQNNQQNNKENNQNIQNVQTNNGQRIVVNFVPGTGRRILQPTNQAPQRQPLQYTYQWPHGQQPPRPQFQQPPQQLQHPLRWQIQGQGHLSFPQRPPSSLPHLLLPVRNTTRLYTIVVVAGGQCPPSLARSPAEE